MCVYTTIFNQKSLSSPIHSVGLESMAADKYRCRSIELVLRGGLCNRLLERGPRRILVPIQDPPFCLGLWIFLRLLFVLALGPLLARLARVVPGFELLERVVLRCSPPLPLPVQNLQFQRFLS